MQLTTRQGLAILCVLMVAGAGLLVAMAPAAGSSTVDIGIEDPGDDLDEGETVSVDLLATDADTDGTGAFEVTISTSETVDVAVAGTDQFEIETGESGDEKTIVGYTGQTDTASDELTLAEIDLTATESGDGGITLEEVETLVEPTDGEGVTYTTGEQESDEVTFSITDPGPVFDIDSVAIDDEVEAGEEITAEATVENVGTEDDTQDVSLLVDGNEQDTTELGLDEDESEAVELSYTTSSGDVGDLSIATESEDDTVSETVTVTEEETEEDEGDDGPTIIPPGDGTDDDEADEEETDDERDAESTVLDPEEIAGAIETPDDVAPTRAEQSTVETDEETGLAQVSFTAESSVEQISFDGETAGDVTVAEYESEPAETGLSPGQSVSVSQFNVPNPETSATITQRLSTDRLDEFGAAAEDLQVNRFDDEWQPLDTEVIEESDGEIVLEAETPGFSYFSTSVTSDPVPAFDATPTDPEMDETVTFDASESEDEHGEIVAYEWTIDGEELTGEQVTETFESSGDVEVELAVRNDANRTASTTETITVADLEAAFEVTEIDAPATADPGEQLDVAVTIANTGDSDGDEQLTYSFDGETESEESVGVDAGESETVSVTVTAPEDAGEFDHEAAIAGTTETETTTVEDEDTDDADDVDEQPTEEDDADDDDDGFAPGFGVVAAVFALALVVTVARHRTNQQ